MNNRYISRYAAGETRFRRTDPWPTAVFEDDVPNALVQVAQTAAVVAVIFLFVLGGILIA